FAHSSSNPLKQGRISDVEGVVLFNGVSPEVSFEAEVLIKML
ncbi:55_t:CDS:1, partial [Paraglomus occultum]